MSIHKPFEFRHDWILRVRQVLLSHGMWGDWVISLNYLPESPPVEWPSHLWTCRPSAFLMNRLCRGQHCHKTTAERDIRRGHSYIYKTAVNARIKAQKGHKTLSVKGSTLKNDQHRRQIKYDIDTCIFCTWSLFLFLIVTTNLFLYRKYS